MAAKSKIDLKVVLLGAQSTGKTCLVNRYLHNEFDDKQVTTVGAAFGSKCIDVQGRSFVLGIWDTAGSERYESMARMYYRAAGAAAICFDLTSAESFKKVEFWIRELRENEPSCRVYIVGTKSDLIESRERPRAVDRLEAESLATKLHAQYFETSAKTGKGVVELFQAMGRDAHELRAQDIRETVTHSAAPSSTGSVPSAASTASKPSLQLTAAPAEKPKPSCC